MKKFILKRLIASSFVIGSALALCSCAPRGETKSLDEILADSKSKFSAQIENTKSSLEQGVAESIAKLNDSLAGVLSHANKGSDVADASTPVISSLEPLILKAGYASRPALGEILMQHRVLLNDLKNGEKVSEARIKLLVARTYATVTSELESTKFAVKQG